MSGKQVVRNRFKAPEGRYELVAERTQGLMHFHYQRSTRLTLATVMGGAEDGAYVLFNVGELVHVSHWDTTQKEPIRSIALTGASSTIRSMPTCHAYQAVPGREGADTLVGMSDGTIHLLSLRAQLAAPPGAKAAVAASLTPEGGSEARQIVAVTWLPNTDGLFAAASAGGNIFLYRKGTILGDGGSRFSLSLGSGSKSATPQTLTLSGRGIHDLAASPDGTRLAVACADGAVRLVDVSTGTVVGGFQSYYGAVLCCSYSPDGRYVAAAGEDDLITVYSIAERYPVAHCQGHDSWVSRVHWDPWMQLGGGNGGGGPGMGLPNGGGGAGLTGPDASRVYRLASVGQDAQMCLWDVQILPMETDFFGASALSVTSPGGVRKSNSTASLGGLGAARGSGELGGSHHQRKPSISKPANLSATGITPALTRGEMNVVQPSMQHRVHVEPLCDVLFTESCVLTADHSGSIRTWRRPPQIQRLSMQRAALFQAAAELDR